MRRPRVLVLTPDFPPAHGGIQVLVDRVVGSWRRVDARVVTLGSRRDRPHGDERVPVVRVRVRGGVSRRIAIVALNAVSVGEGIRTRPDAVLAAHIVVSPAAAALSRTLGVPFVQYLHGREVTARPRLAAFALARATAAIAVSRYTASLAEALGADARRVRLIPPGVDLPGEPSAARARSATVVTIARLDERYKGHDVLLRAMPLVRARVPDARLVVVGDGALRPSYERLAESLALNGGVEFAGSLDDDRKTALLEGSSVLAMPSRIAADGGGEGFGIVYLEAGALGVPVVAGGVGGAVDAVVDGETGILVDPTDHVAVADTLAGLLADRDTAAELGRRGAERARSFAWPVVSERVEDLLLTLVGEPR